MFSNAILLALPKAWQEERMPLTLKPPEYTCPTHRADLTEQVRSQLEQEQIPVAGYDNFYYEIRKPRISEQPFTVIAKCPGKKSDQAHEVECSGQYSAS
jgi:hypothetical protein